MGLKEAVQNRINALVLKNYDLTVCTNTSEIGIVQETSVLRGTITIKIDKDTTQVFPGREVDEIEESRSREKLLPRR